MAELPMDRILRSITKTDAGCWEWNGARSKNGYGSVGLARKIWRAHRLAYAAFVADPGELHVLHRCDNPPCCNPDHLFLGTPAINAADKSKKGRTGREKRWGERNNKAKLTENDVRMIRSSKETGGALARQLGVSRALVNMVRRNIIWSHVNV